jgi:hypothetical protein
MSDQNEETTTSVPKGEIYKLRLEGGGVVVNREVDEAVALQIIAAVMGGGSLPRVFSAGQGGARAVDLPRSGPPRSGVVGLSPREHMEEFEPKRNVDKILALAAYVADAREQDTFTPDDVKREFRNASEPVPGNYSRDWRWAVANGWLAKADGAPGEYYVTTKGRDALSAKFSDEVKKTTGVTKTSRRRRTTKKQAEETM